MKITEFGVQELNQEEMKAIQGGWIGAAWKVLKYLLTAAAIHDAVDEFVAGFKEENCKCK